MKVHYERRIDELENRAAKWWPSNLSAEIAKDSSIPLLLETQERFISILKLSGKHPQQIFQVAEAANFPGNVLLKHLVVLADYGGEKIQRLNMDFGSVFECGGDEVPYMEGIFNETKFRYEFQGLPVRGHLTNKKLNIDGASIGTPVVLDRVMTDMAMILVHGASVVNANRGDLERCDVGSYVGKENDLDGYIQQKYIWVSRITGGSTANSQGQLVQTYVCNHLRNKLGRDFEVCRNGTVDLAGYEKKTGMPFDIVVRKNGRCVGIEVSFQVTTNSTIERKAGQSYDRRKIMHANEHRIAYVIDGVGNFQRRSAISTICANSDCTVAYQTEELDLLADFIQKTLP